MKGGSKFQFRAAAVGNLLRWGGILFLTLISLSDAIGQLPHTAGDLIFLDSGKHTQNNAELGWWVKPGRVNAFELDAALRAGQLGPNDLELQGWNSVRVPGAAESAPIIQSDHLTFSYLKKIEFLETFDTDLLISLGQVSDRDRTYFNGKLIGLTGEWDASQAQAYDKPRFYHLPKEWIRTNQINTLIVEVRRYFSDASGILHGSVYLGPTDAVMRRFFILESAQIWVVPCYLVISVAFFFMYWQRSKQVEYGVFGVFTLFLCFYVSLRSPIRFVWDFDFIFWKRIEYLLCFSLGSILYCFLELFLSGGRFQLPLWQRRIGLSCHVLAVGVLLVVIATDNPLIWFWIFNHGIIYLWGIFAFLAFRLLARRVASKDKDALWMAVGLGSFLCAVIVDILKIKDIHSAPVMFIGYGCFALIVSIAFVLAHRFLRVYRQVEYLNSHLESEVKEQTLELRQAMEAAQAADGVKSQFLANVSHELRTPMNGIVGMKHLLAQTELSAQQKEYLSTLTLSTQSLRDLIDGMLDFSSLEKKRQRQNHEDFELRSLVDQNISALQGQIQDRGITVRQNIHLDVPLKVRGDSHRIAQVTHHLLRNALKFTHQGSIEIKISLIAAAKAADLGVTSNAIYYAKVEVIDSGIGVPPDMLDKIFQPFTQVDSTLTRNYGGVGVGLAICKRLAQHLDGVISVESEVGKGSCFYFIIPLHAPRERASSIAPKSNIPINGKDGIKGALPCILMVEDNEINLRYLKLIMEKAGYKVVTARHGKEALQVLEYSEVDLVLMDLQMPIMDGLEATRKIRESERMKLGACPLPVVALTAHGGADDRRRAMDAGMNAYFVKPIDPDALKLAVKSFIDQSRILGNG
jgi:signal transduction histidine kinase/ActR/RegA family two-component response regulator